MWPFPFPGNPNFVLNELLFEQLWREALNKMSILALEHKDTGNNKMVFFDFSVILLIGIIFWLFSQGDRIALGLNTFGKWGWLC